MDSICTRESKHFHLAIRKIDPVADCDIVTNEAVEEPPIFGLFLELTARVWNFLEAQQLVAIGEF